MPTASYKIRGLDCAEEVAALRRELGPMPGISELAFDVLNARMTVEYDDASTDSAAIIAAVARTGMAAEPWRESNEGQQEEAWWERWGRTVTTTLSGLLLSAAFATHAAGGGLGEALSGGEIRPVPYAARVLYLLAAIAGAWYVLPKAWIALRRFRPDMNLLMTIAVLGAIGIGEWFEAATVSFLFSLSLALESWSVGRARRAIGALLSLAPTTARVLTECGCESEINAGAVPVGSRVLVRPGEKFPLDGSVVKGETTANQAPITGESEPVQKEPGSEVFAGTINGDGAVEFVTTKPAADTTLARIIRMVRDAQSRRAPSEQWVEQFARYYTPAVMALALAIMVAPPLFWDGAWARWFYQGLVLLVIACPCALVISTPVSIVAALASAARHGILIKGGVFVELPSRLKAVAFDKTGTLTEGRPEVRGVHPLDGHSEEELLTIAAAIESRSEHPLARAIVHYAELRGVRPPPAEDLQAIRGKGATAAVEGRPHWLGSHRLLAERGQETDEVRDHLARLSGAGTSVVVVGDEERVFGFLSIGDAVRPNAAANVAELRRAGIEHVIMLTGDNRATAEAVARQTGVDEVRAELLPEDKVQAIEELTERYGTVAMVGEGVNDAPAMARSSLGVAMGVAGTDAALETADVALMSDDLSRLPWLVHHSRRTLAIIRQNIVASLAVKAIFVLLTFAGRASLWAAIAADMGMSLLVVFNALRLLQAGDGERRKDKGHFAGTPKPA